MGALWGAIATVHDTTAAFCAAGAGLLVGALALSRVRLAPDEGQDLTPTRHWPEPRVVGAPNPESGPVLVEVEYRIDPARAADFIRAARELESVRRRGGSVEWWLLRDAEDAGRYVEIFASETWAEHLRQHERVSAADREVEQRVQAFLVGPPPLPTRHLIAAWSDEAGPGLAGAGPPV